MNINRENLFSKWNDVSIRKEADSSYMCYECKLNDNKDKAISNVQNAVYHIQAHLNDGHKLWSHTIKNIRLAKRIDEECVTTVEVHYAITNNGDGSASTRFFKTREDAKKFDEYEQDHYDGWGESEFFSEKLHFDKDGILINCDTFEEAIKDG